MVYCTAETTHDQTQTISIIRCRKNSVKCKYIDFWPISDFFFSFKLGLILETEKSEVNLQAGVCLRMSKT